MTSAETAEPIASGPIRRRATIVIANPATRTGIRVVARTLAQWRPGLDVDLWLTEGPGSAAALARLALPVADLIVAAGGDGTVGEVASALAGTGRPLGILPCGSTNIVAGDLGIPGDLGAAADLLAGPHRLRRIDMGRAGDRAMLHMAGAGFDSRIFAYADPRWKRRAGWVAYLPAGAKALREPAERFTIVADGERFVVRSSMVLVANSASIIVPRLRIHPDPRLDDGVLDLLIVTASRPAEIASTLARALTGRLDRSTHVIHRRVQHVRLEADRPIPFQVDGDIAGTLPADITLEPRSLAVIVPPFHA